MKKKIIIITVIVGVMLIFIEYLFWANKQADYYAQVSRETLDTQEQIVALKKSIQLWPKTENILTLTDLYISIGRNDLAEEIMAGRGDPDILNKLGNLYLSENKTNEAEKAFAKVKDKSLNSDSLKGLILVELKSGDRGVAENYLNKLANIDPVSAHCYYAFINLNNFEKANNAFKKTKNCTLYGIDEYFVEHKTSQNPLYLKLEAVNLYYSNGYLNMAEEDILALIKEKDNYRDAHILASKIYEEMGDQAKSDEHKQKALEIDPVEH